MEDLKLGELALHITKELFKAGDEPNSLTSRIEFKGKKHGSSKEIAQGGLCFNSLVEHIEQSLRDY